MEINATTLTLTVAVCSILSFFIGQYLAVKKTGYEQGQRDAKIDSMANKIEELTKEVKDWNMGALVQRVVALEKAVFKGGNTDGN